MRTHEQLAQALRQAAEAYRPDLDWPGFQARRRRSRIRRALAYAAAASLAAAAAVAIPRIAAEREPSPATEPTLRASTAAHRDRVLGYQLTYPAGWVREGSIGGGVQLAPSKRAMEGEGGIPVLFEVAVGPDLTFGEGSEPVPFGRRVARVREEAHSDAKGTPRVRERSTTVAGRPAVEFQIDYPPSKEPRECEVWGCRERVILIEWSDRLALSVHVIAGTPRHWQTYGPDADEIVASLRTYEPPPGVFVPAHTTYPVGIPEDERTEALLRFLDARAERSGAERWLSAQAKEQYEAPEEASETYPPSGLRLYPGKRFDWRYRILSRTEQDEGRSVFKVQIEEIPRPISPEEAIPWTHYPPRERLVVGSGANSFREEAGPVVLSAERAPSCDAPPGSGCV